ncbi:hypothetical protein AAC387_Pa02g2561 [Persea americana]
MNSTMQDSKSSSLQDPTTEPNYITRFDKSLQELKALRSQLHYAADYCETTFLAAKQKKKVVENTKKYICKAMVTVVDHLGSASANLDNLIEGGVDSSPTDLRIDSLKQRLLTCQMYTSKLNLDQAHWSTELPRHHGHYNITQSQKVIAQHGRPDGAKRYPLKFSVVDEKVRQGTQTDFVVNIKNFDAQLTSGFELSKALPVSEGPSILWRPRNFSFPSGEHQLVRNEKSKKASVSSKIKRML